MAKRVGKHRVRVRGAQRDDIDADLLLQALLLMVEDAHADARTIERKAPLPRPEQPA